MNIQKNNTLELLKLFSSYMIVFIHVPFGGKVGEAMDVLARFAVPFFFLVSGYYSYQINCEKIKKRIQNILSLLVFSMVSYTVFEIIMLLKYNREGLAVLFNKYTQLSTYIGFFVFNAPVNFGHLWYLLAIFYVYIIFYFVTKFNVKEKVIFTISLFLLALNLLLEEGLSLFGIVLPIPVVRNFATMGIPFFALGLFVKKHESKFRSIPDYVTPVFIAFGALVSLISAYFLGTNELYVGSLFILTAIICVFVKRADAKTPPFLTALEGCSTYIYIFHIMISTVIFIIYGVLGIDIYSSVILENLHPVIVCVASTVFAYLFIKISKRASVLRKN